jgi:hypothetical protein
MMAIDKWRSYLHRNPFLIRIYYQSLCHLQDQTLSTDLQKKAMRKLSRLQFRFAYKKGSENKVADALSQIGAHLDLNAISAVILVWVQEVINFYHSDSATTSLLQELAINSPNAQGYSLVDGVIRHKTKIWVGSNASLHTKLISAFHASALGGILLFRPHTTG